MTESSRDHVKITPLGPPLSRYSTVELNVNPGKLRTLLDQAVLSPSQALPIQQEARDTLRKYSAEVTFNVQMAEILQTELTPPEIETLLERALSAIANPNDVPTFYTHTGSSDQPLPITFNDSSRRRHFILNRRRQLLNDRSRRQRQFRSSEDRRLCDVFSILHALQAIGLAPFNSTKEVQDYADAGERLAQRLSTTPPENLDDIDRLLLNPAGTPPKGKSVTI